MKKWAVATIILIMGFGSEWGIGWWWSRQIDEIKVEQPKEFPLLKYSIEKLGEREYSGSEITLEDVTQKTEKYEVKKFYYKSDGKKVTGLAHIPNDCSADNKCPVIVQFRGYADVDGYYSGFGTSHTAEIFAANGYVTLAPDFLGYGGSDDPSVDVWEARFETYTTAINLLKSLKSLPFADEQRVGIWGHSNGGQIALTVLEIMGGNYPTAVWNPVSIYFPYSVLYYTDDNNDEGVALRKEVERLEVDYNLQAFSLTDHLDRIQDSLFLQQGGADQSVPQKWSDALYTKLKALGKNISYQVYPGADHNMIPKWDQAVQDDVAFYDQLMAK